MRLGRFLAATLAGATLAVGVTATQASATTTPPSAPTLAGILAAQGPIGDGNWYDFDIINGVVGAILQAKPESPLALATKADGPKLTVFLPNDRAFQALAADLLGWRYWFVGEGRVAQGLLGALDVDTLERVVLYHVTLGEIDSATALGVPKGTKLDMVGGGQVTVTPLPWLKSAVLGDNDPNDINPTLVRSKLDIRAANGIAHGISFVLRPSDL